MRNVVCWFALGLAFVLAGCDSLPVTNRTTARDESESAIAGSYKLRAMDPLQISLLGIPDEKQLETVIDEKGQITLPYISEPIQASGLTTSELERKIQHIYTEGQIYRSITINVSTSAKSYYMEGEVTRPQEYPLNSRITLLQAIAAASGYTEYANKRNITITRNGRILKLNGREIENHPDQDIPVEAGDRIKVHRSMF